MEITVYVDDRDAERLAVLLHAMNAFAREENTMPWTIDDVAMITLSRGIESAEKTYSRYIPDVST